MEPQNVVYVTAQSILSVAFNELSLLTQLDIGSVSAIFNIRDLITLEFIPDLIICDIARVCEETLLPPKEIVNFITLLVATGDNGKPIKVAAAVDSKCDVKLIKEILQSGVCGIYPEGYRVSFDEKNNAINKLAAGVHYIPEQVKQRLWPTEISAGDVVLTPRQMQVLDIIKHRGASNKAIAKILNISESAVKIHVTAILKKFGVKNRTQLALFS